MQITRVVGVLLLAASCSAQNANIYEPGADAWKQLEAAGQRAAAEKKRVLAVVGGDW